MDHITEQMTSGNIAEEDPLEQESNLVEFETKTTPTCLSSYLRQ
jgi:hypothetical protein